MLVFADFNTIVTKHTTNYEIQEVDTIPKVNCQAKYFEENKFQNLMLIN